MAHSMPLIFGRDIVFTYGPLAYLSYPDAHEIKAASVVLWNFSIYSITIYLLVNLVRRCQLRNVVATILVVLSFNAAIKFGFGSQERIQYAFLLSAWLLILDCSLADIRFWALAGVLAGTSLLVKFNDGVVNVAVFYCIYVCGLVRSKKIETRTVLLGVTPPLSFLTIFFAVNKLSLSALYGYVRSSLQLSSGYSEAMSIIGPDWQVGLAAIGITVLLVILLWKGEVIPYRSFAPTLLVALAAFKHCMVRQDGHAVPFHIELAGASVFGLLAARGSIRRFALMAFAGANLLAGILILRVEVPTAYINTEHFLELRSIPNDIDHYSNLARSWRQLDSATTAALSVEKSSDAQRIVRQGTVDDLSWNVDFIRANGFNWNPRPIFQSYAAYEPTLDRLNANHLKYFGADFLNLRLEDVDQRHPFLDDALTWQAVLNLYDIAGGGLDGLLLKRRSAGRFTEPRTFGRPLQVRWNQTIKLPPISSNAVLLMRAQVNLSLWGRLRNIVFRVDPAYLEVTYESGSKVKYRFTRPNLVNGAIISELPRSISGMFPLLGYEDSRKDSVASIRWISNAEAEFSPLIKVFWSTINFKSTERTPVPIAHPDISSFVSIWKPGDDIVRVGALSATTNDDRLILRPNNVDPQILLSAPQDLGKFKTILIRAKFSVSDQINLFFGQQGNGRGFGGYVPVADEWLDIYIHTNMNPFWQNEAGAVLRFDPVTDLYRNSQIEVAGIWASTQSFPSNGKEMTMDLSLSVPSSAK